MKLIYQPKGKAYEYCKWACNLYNGCSNRCTYCYNRHCMAKALLGKDEPTLKSGLKSKEDAYRLFKKEFDSCKDKIMADGGELFFNFVSDPFLDETFDLNVACMVHVFTTSDVTVRTLTKCARNLYDVRKVIQQITTKERWKIGFTLTGMDELEPGADTNEERIDVIRKLSAEGHHTWASIEPVIRPAFSYLAILDAYNAGCRHFKIGLLSGKKSYTYEDILIFKKDVDTIFYDCEIVWKESVIKFLNL